MKTNQDRSQKSSMITAALLGVLTAMASSAALGDEPAADKISARIMAGTKLIKNTNSLGNLIGVGYARYESENFFVGGVIHTGQLSSTQTGSYSQGGLIGGYDRPLIKGMNLMGEILLGAAGGFSGTSTNGLATTGGGFVIEPTVGVDFALAKSVHTKIDVGYALMTSSTALSSFSFGVRIDFLTYSSK